MKITSFKAVKVASLQTRPDEIPPREWTHIHRLEKEIATFYPTPCPGQRKLGERLGVSARTIKRYLAMAVRYGRIEVWADAGKAHRGRRPTNLYALSYLNIKGTKMSPYKGDKNGPPNTSPPNGGEVQSENLEPPVLGFEEVKQAIPAESLEGKPMAASRSSDEDPASWGRGFGDDPDPEMPTAVVHIDPALRLAHHFRKQWVAAVRKHPGYRGIRPIDIGPASGYIRNTMFKTHSPDYVEAFIDAFCEAVRNDLVEIKPGQSAWERFQGWWGRTDVEDPEVHRQRKAEYDQGMAAYRRQMADREKSSGAS